MTDEITQTQNKELLYNAFRNGKPIFSNTDYTPNQNNYSSKNNKYNIYIELLINSLCTDKTLSAHTNIPIKKIWELNMSLFNHLLSFEYYVCNDNGCNVFCFYTLNTELYNEYKDIDTSLDS